MYSRGFSFEKLRGKSKGRRSSEPSVQELIDVKKNERRNSVANPMVVITEASEASGAATRQRGDSGSLRDAHGVVGSGRLRAQSMTFINGPASRSRSRSVSKKQAKRLIVKETSQVIGKKLNSFLAEYGLQKPVALKARTSGHISKTVQIYVANSRDCIFLAPASSASFTYEDVENGGVNPTNDGGQATSEFTTSSLDASDPSIETQQEEKSGDEDIPLEGLLNGNEIPQDLLKKIKNFNSPNYLCTKIDSDTPIPHTFAVIVDLKKESTIKDVTFEFKSSVNLLWPSGEPYSKEHFKESFKIGHMEWQTSLGDCDFYLNTLNTNEVKCKDLSPEDLSRRTREYKLVNVADLATGSDNINGNHNTSSFSPIRKKSISVADLESSSSHDNSNEVYKPGMYVFLLPILLPEHIPPTILSINGSLNHTLNLKFNKVSDKLSRKTRVSSSYNLPMVRTPPSSANSIADKPIYVSRVWNDSLHYVITFPKKYVPLGSEQSINVKLSPLVKNIIVKRIKFNILERITYVSRDLSKEYDYDSDDPYLLRSAYPDKKTRERTISICELKTKSKSSNTSSVEPYKEEVIKCPENNLLFSCYEPELDDLNLEDPLSKNDGQSMIANSLDINIALPFLTTMQDRNILTSSSVDDDTNSELGVTSRRASIYKKGSVDSSSHNFTPSSNVIGTLETNLSHDCIAPDTNDDDDVITPDSSAFMSETERNKANIKKGYTNVSRALYPDCNFRHIQIHHRLQVCFRISKPDPNDNFKMHHYEVVVDTPLVLLSAKCNDVSIQLPTYNEVENMPQHTESVKPDKNNFEFRIPNFNADSPVSNSETSTIDGCLPSFEEAMSQPSSPIVRSLSLGDDPLTGLSRMSSIDIPSEPAPSYDVATNSSDDLTSTFNIDAVVTDENNISRVKSTRSKLRDSLASSFAPILRNGARDSESTSTPGSNEQVTSDSASSESKPISVSTVESLEDSLLEGKARNDADSSETCRSSSNDYIASGDNSEYPVMGSDYKNITPVATVESALEGEQETSGEDDLQGLNKHFDEGLYTLGNDDKASMVSEETSNNFDLRLPLLAHCSEDSFNKSRTTLATETNMGFAASKDSLTNSSQHQLRNVYPLNNV